MCAPAGGVAGLQYEVNMISDEVFKTAWGDLTPFKMPNLENGFLDNTYIYRKFMESDLQKSGLNSIHVHGTINKVLSLPQGATSGYILPYLTPEGQFVTDDQGSLGFYRMRLERGEHSKESRYTQPTGEYLNKIGLPSFIPYIHPLTLSLKGERMICAEGEKKTVSIIRHLGLPAFGIGGYQMWRDPNGSGGIHPWIKRVLERRKIKQILIVPDGDLLRYDICSGYGTFAHTLRQAGYDVQICNPSGKIDDLLVEWGDDAHDRFGSIPKMSIDELVQSHSFLSKQYDLAFRENDKGVVLHQTTSNIVKLLEEHPAFPKIWKNLDNNRIHIGEEMAVPDLTEMKLANYFQHNLKLEKITHRMMFSCIQALAKQNQKSPFMEWVKQQTWDGQSRLSSWMIRHWGVEDTPFVREVSMKWLVGACARLHKPGTKIDWMLIVIGPQGVGKTSMPSLVFKTNSLTLYGDCNDKDLHMKLHSALVIGFDELDSFGKRESGFLKAMISTAEDHFRPPYGSSVEVFGRRCTLYGCGNRQEYLQSDPSGYRRYPTVLVNQKLDFAGLEGELDQLWAEAWHRYNMEPVEYWEIVGASKEAEKYVTPSALEEELGFYLELTKQNSTNVKKGFAYTQYRLVLQCPTIKELRPQPRDVAAVMRKLGWTKKQNDRGPSGKGNPSDWWVFTLDPQ